MIKEPESIDKAVVLYTIDTEYKVGIKILTNKEFNRLCSGA